MIRKSDKIRAWELQMMSQKIRVLSGLSTGPTVTLTEIGKSWLDHEPLYNKLSAAIYHNSNLIHLQKIAKTILITQNNMKKLSTIFGK